jgi:uncharacterized protein (DUF983 family)
MATLGRRFRAIFLQRCPRCLEGKVFTGSFKMAETCPICEYRFEKEPGYFLGAMYASYFMSIPLLGILTLLSTWFIVPSWRLEYAALLAGIPYLFLVPLVFRYSRIFWMHIDPPPALPAEPGTTKDQPD